MKKIITIFGFLIIISSIISCDDFLDRSPLDTLTAENLSFSAVEMEMYANTFYVNLPGLPWWYSNWTGDGGSDNMVPRTFDRWDKRLAGTVTVPEYGGGWSWNNIRNVNYFLDNYRKSKEPINIQKKYAGEIYFWKAWFYFDLLKRFGDLPWYTHCLETTSEELYAPRVSRSIVVDSILNILDYAIDYLPVQNETEVNRLHKDVARLFKARVALYEGTWEKYHANTAFAGDGRDFNRYFIEARDAVEIIINSGKYQIWNNFSHPTLPINYNDYDYWSLFVNNTLIGNPEILLSREYDFDLGLSHWGGQFAWEGGMDGNGLSKSLIDSYLCKDGLPISISPLYHGDETIHDLIIDRDLRLEQTVMIPGESVIDARNNLRFNLPVLTAMPWPNTTGYQQFKYVPTLSWAEGGSTNDAVTAFPIFRYAEALLIFAEAHAELGTCTQEILNKTINILRDRAHTAHLNINVGFIDPEWDFPNLSPLINEIRRERRIELALEGFREDDLLRWAATDVIQKPLLGSKYNQWIDKPFSPALSGIPVNKDGYIAPYLNSLGESGRPFDPSKNYLYPLPTNELVLNPNLKQNPGY